MHQAVLASALAISSTDCTYQTMGSTVTYSYETTFASDGSSAHTVESITITNGSASCASTYDVTYTRQ